MTEQSGAPVTALITDKQGRTTLRIEDLKLGTVIMFGNARCTVIEPATNDPYEGDIWVQVEWLQQ